MKIIQIVRRYGSVGGMERYVWELSQELRNLGHEVTVVCEICRATPPEGIAVHETGEMVYRPRWLYYWRFGRRVARWFAQHPQADDVVVHSHERVSQHQVTTFHGPPFATVHDKPWWKLLSLRVVMQLYMERRELRTAQHIVPNSPIIARQLARYYPEYAPKLTAPIVPGVAPSVVRTARDVPPRGGVVGFVGYEWQRKGLPLAVSIMAQLRRERPDVEFWVVGAKEDEVRPLFADWDGGYRLLGWRTDNAHFQQIDVLLHPAKAEPYGMVISEALAAAVPVVISDQCGAMAQVSADTGAVLPLDAPLDAWVAALQQQLNRSTPMQPFVRSWQDMVREYVAVYAQVTREAR